MHAPGDMDNGQQSHHLLDLVSDFLQYHDFEQTVQALNAERQQRRQLLTSSIQPGALPRTRAALKQSLVRSCACRASWLMVS